MWPITTNDAVRSGRPKTATTPEMIEKVDKIVKEDRQVKVVEIADILKIKLNQKEFLRRFVTVDETWIHYTTPETKNQSKQWVESGSSLPKKA